MICSCLTEIRPGQKSPGPAHQTKVVPTCSNQGVALQPLDLIDEQIFFVRVHAFAICQNAVI
jgi:hypothetical protein